GRRARKLPVLDLLRPALLRLALPLAVGVDEGICQDPVQPGLEIRALLELVKRSVGLRVSLLDQVLGVRGVAGHPQGSGIELVEVLERVPLESRSALVLRLGDRTHLLGVRPSATTPDHGYRHTHYGPGG